MEKEFRKRKTRALVTENSIIAVFTSGGNQRVLGRRHYTRGDKELSITLKKRHKASAYEDQRVGSASKIECLLIIDLVDKSKNG